MLTTFGSNLPQWGTYWMEIWRVKMAIYSNSCRKRIQNRKKFNFKESDRVQASCDHGNEEKPIWLGMILKEENWLDEVTELSKVKTHEDGERLLMFWVYRISELRRPGSFPCFSIFWESASLIHSNHFNKRKKIWFVIGSSNENRIHYVLRWCFYLIIHPTETIF